MKQLLILVGCMVLGVVAAGCQNSAGGTENIVDNNGRFPAFLAGTWQEDSRDSMSCAELRKQNEICWQFTFEPDGSISSMMHYYAGLVEIAQGGVEKDLGGGGFAVEILGPCLTSYDPNSRQLVVDITIEYFRLELPSGEIEGNLRDKIIGRISEDGRRWDASWLNYSQVEGSDARMEDSEILMAGSMSFIKIEGK